MKRSWILALVFSLFFFSQGAAQTDHSGIIKTVSGTVNLLRKGNRFQALPSMHLKDGDTLITGHMGYAGLLFKDGTAITIGPRTEFEIKTYIFEPQDHAYFFSFFMKKGSMIYNSGKIGKLSPQSVRLETPKATVGIRGTRFIVDIN